MAADPKPDWNARHAKAIAEGRGDRPPADWLFEHAAVIAAQPRGRALDVACGRGRNALYLAAQGFEVDAFDLSDAAVEHLRHRAAERELPVRAWVADATRQDLERGAYSIVVNAFFFERETLGALAEALVPGGLLFFVTFLEGNHGLRPGELREAFAGLEVVDYREGAPLPGDRARACLVGRRP